MLAKEKKLNDLKNIIFNDKNLPLLKSNLVFGEGSAYAEIFFIGEAPGVKEDELKRPFVGRSGKFLTKTLESVGLKREDIYITNIIKRRPPDNRDPSIEEIKAYGPYLKKQIEIIKPKILVTLGRFALNYFIPEMKITQCQGKIFKINNLTLMPMFHPAAALRSTTVLKSFQKGFRELKKISSS